MSVYDRYEQYADKTFRAAAEKYLDDFTGKCRKRQWYALQHVMPYIGDLLLNDVDDAALREYKRDRIKFAMVGTVNKELATVTAVLNRAARVWRWIPSAPLLQRLKGDHRKPYPLSWAESRRMFMSLDGNLQKIALFAINTGVRREEIFKLKWVDERSIDGVMVFILRDTKNGQDRPVICNSIARRIVEYMRKPCTYVPRDRKQLNNFARSDVYVFPRIALSKPLEQVWKIAGLPDDPLIKKGPHNFRHTFGHRLRAEGVEPEDRDMLLGHHNRSLTQHYASPDIKRLAELAERITVPRDTAVLR